MDIQAVCSGFVFALATADNFIRCGQAQRALVIGAETFSRILDWKDRNTCVLFGDGAGAVVLEAGEGNGNSERSRHPLHAPLLGRDLLRQALCRWRSVGDADRPGSSIWKARKSSAMPWSIWRRRSMPPSPRPASRPDDVDWLVPHQANRRIIDSMGNKLKLAPEKVVVTDRPPCQHIGRLHPPGAGRSRQ